MIGNFKALNQTYEFLEAIGPQSQSDLVETCTIERDKQSIMCK